MVRQKIPAAALVVLVVIAFGAVLIVVLQGSSKQPDAAAAATTQPSEAPALATYSERVPHVASQLNAYALQGTVRGAASTPQPTDPPVSASAFRAPVAAYKAYSEQQLELMEDDITRLRTDLAAGDRAAAQDAWRDAFADYLRLGAVYLEGPVADLDQAIDGNPGGLKGGTASPQFTGLHRIEFGLWTGAPLASLEPTRASWHPMLSSFAGSCRGCRSIRSITRRAPTRFSRTPSATCSMAPTFPGAARVCSARRRASPRQPR
ncbi:MAG: EfeM/EfeO family lipoprotein [Solirubrobacteraceae bacterium]